MQNFIVDATNDTIDISTTWDYDTVFVDTTLTILDDVVLTIEPGTAIIFNGFYKFTVLGTLLSEGTEVDTIKYTVADTTGFWNYTHTAWDGIEFDNSDDSMSDNDTSSFAYCAFYFAREKSTNFDAYGGGVITVDYYAVVKIRNSIFMNNSAYGEGGAIGAFNEAIVLVDSCYFVNNTAYNSDLDRSGGGAIALGCYDDEYYFNQSVISNSVFYQNKSLCFYGDTVRFGGGAVKISGYNDAYVYNCKFIENYSTTKGGAMIVSGYSQPYIVNNLFLNNIADNNGGAVAIMYDAGGYHINNTVVGNYSGNNGGGYSIGCDNDSCFFANNIIGDNTDLDNDTAQIYIAVQDDTYDMEFHNNNIQDGLVYTEPFQSGNIDEDPLMIDPENGDFRLACTSPCKDIAKDTLNYFPDFDLLGMPRLVDGGYDLGAFETQLAVPMVIGGDLIICDGNSTILDVGDYYETYMWSTAEETQTIEVSIAGFYSVTVTNEYLCEDADEIEVIVNSLPVVDLGEDQIIDNTQSIQLDAGAFDEYLWSTAETTQSITVDGEDIGVGVYTYSVVVTDQNLCTGEDDIEITVVDLSGIDEADIALTSIYPNPSYGIFNINAPIGSTAQIIDVTGKIVRTISFESDNVIGIDLTDFESGIYYAKFLGNKINKTEKIIVK